MVDPKRLIESMELCMGAERDCHKCMYCETENDCRDSMIYDAVELLKEHGPVKPIIKTQELNGEIIKYYGCGICKTPLPKTFRFCQMCGRAVKWDE